MYVRTTKRTMIDRKIVQKDKTISVAADVGKRLVDKGDAYAVKTPDSANKPKTKTAATKDKDTTPKAD